MDLRKYVADIEALANYDGSCGCMSAVGGMVGPKAAWRAAWAACNNNDADALRHAWGAIIANLVANEWYDGEYDFCLVRELGQTITSMPEWQPIIDSLYSSFDNVVAAIREYDRAA